MPIYRTAIWRSFLADNLLATTGDNVLENAATINTLLQLLMLFVPIVALLAIVRGAMGRE